MHKHIRWRWRNRRKRHDSLLDKGLKCQADRKGLREALKDHESACSCTPSSAEYEFELRGWSGFRSALHWGAKRNHQTVVQYLLTQGADRKAVDKDGKTAAELTTSAEIHSLLGGGPLRLRIDLSQYSILFLWLLKCMCAVYNLYGHKKYFY